MEVKSTFAMTIYKEIEGRKQRVSRAFKHIHFGKKPSCVKATKGNGGGEENRTPVQTYS
jgi:hypothetical protein